MLLAVIGMVPLMILSACGARPFGDCQPRYWGTAEHVWNTYHVWCIDYGFPPEEGVIYSGATWQDDPISGGLRGRSGDCWNAEGNGNRNSPVFFAYGDVPPGTPDAFECMVRYPDPVG